MTQRQSKKHCYDNHFGTLQNFGRTKIALDIQYEKKLNIPTLV